LPLCSPSVSSPWSWFGRVSLVVVLLAATSAPAFAQDPPNVVQARELLARGNLLLEQGNFDAALTEFQRAYDVVGDHPVRYVILFNIGKAHERMFRYDLALEYYNRYLQEGGPQAEDRATVEATIQTLQGLLATLAISVNVPQAEVWVDDRMVGTAPGRVSIPGGRHVVELRAAGYTSAQQEVQIPARTEQALTFVLEELADEYRGLTPIVFWSTAGAGVAALAIGGVFGILAVAKRGDVDDQLADPVEMWDGGRLEEERGSIQDLALVADIFFIGGAVLGVGALVLAFLTDWSGGEAETQTAGLSLAPRLSSDELGLTLGGAL
jgi:hypothetical protein